MTQPEKRNLFAVTCFLLIFVFLAAATPLLYFLLQGSSSGDHVEVVIPRGATVTQVVTQLHSEGVIGSPTFFKYLVRATDGASKVRAGEYEFRKSMRALSALQTLYYGEPILHDITVPEGWTIRQIAAELEAKQLASADEFINLALNKRTAQAYKFGAPTLEGFLFPDTYSFSRSETAESILKAMVGRFREKIRPYEDEARRKGYSIHKLVTLASIVEKETGHGPERPLIAAVFLNRLQKRMRLQSDPTTIYGIPNFNGNLTKRDLQTKTAYNTYRINGLPPGPIANPGEDSIKAVLNPAKSDYLYFVSNNNGTHAFSKTYEEHSRLVDLLQKRRRRRN